MSERPSDLLRRHGLRPKKSWGQNILAEPEVLEGIARALGLLPGEPVVELGAGLGHLTRELARTGARVFAVERDRDMVRVLEGLHLETVTVVAADAARLDFAQTAGAARVAVVGNLPYHLTSPILFQVLDQRSAVSRAAFTVQKEVADRLAADVGTRAYGLLSVLLGMFFRVEELFTVPAHLFHPAPKVDSAVVRLTTLERPLAEVTSEGRFRALVKAGFAQRRKTLWNALRADSSLGSEPQLADALARAGIERSRRAETLSVEEFAALERALPQGP